MLEVSGLVKAFGNLRAVDSVDLMIEAGTITGLIGPNGAGKTTLFNLIAGALAPESGAIRFMGERIDRLTPDRIFARGLARTFQVPRPFPQMTVLENLMLVPLRQAGERFWNNWVGAGRVRRQERLARERAMEVLELCDLAAKAGEIAGRLSGGQQKLLELARVLIAEPRLILLDEPAAGVNPVLLETLVERIVRLNRRGVTIEVDRREIVTLIGPNGAGKSTLLKAIAGLIACEGGRVRLGGRDVTALPAHEVVASGIGFVPQTGNVFTTLTVQENLKVGAHVIRGALNERLERAYGLFPPLAARRTLRARTLSGGERQMLAIARALMTEPTLLMLDEPTAGLAPLVVEEVFRRLRRLAEGGIAVLMVEQNAKAALRVSDRGYVLTEGRNRFAGTARDLLDDPGVAAAFLGGGPFVAPRNR